MNFENVYNKARKLAAENAPLATIIPNDDDTITIIPGRWHREDRMFIIDPLTENLTVIDPRTDEVLKETEFHLWTSALYHAVRGDYRI